MARICPCFTRDLRHFVLSLTSVDVFASYRGAPATHPFANSVQGANSSSFHTSSNYGNQSGQAKKKYTGKLNGDEISAPEATITTRDHLSAVVKPRSEFSQLSSQQGSYRRAASVKSHRNHAGRGTAFLRSSEVDSGADCPGVGHGQNAILELTPDAIDALAAESRQQGSYTEISLAPTSRLSFNHDPFPTKTTTARRGEPRRSISVNPDEKPRFTDHKTASQVEPLQEDESVRKTWEPWQVQKVALKKKFPEGWNPRKRLSPDALAGIRAIHAQFPEQYTLRVLADKFEVSPDVIRRILKSKWTPNESEEVDRQRRWFQRGENVWRRYSELGMKPPARWRKAGVGKETGLASNAVSPVRTTERRDGAYETEHQPPRWNTLSDRIL